MRAKKFNAGESRSYREAGVGGDFPAAACQDGDNLIILVKSEPEEKRNDPLKYKGFQCPFCLARHDLSLNNKQKVKTPFSDMSIDAA